MNDNHNNINIYHKVMAIHDQSMGLLRAMQIPPYPAHYKKFFDEVFMETADEELRKDQSDAEKKVLNPAKDDVTKYLDLAQKSVMSFIESHSNIASVAQMQRQYVDDAPSSTLERCITFIEGLSTLNKTMSDELDKAQGKINDLSAELREAIASVSIDPLTKVGNRKAFMDDMTTSIEVGQEALNGADDGRCGQFQIHQRGIRPSCRRQDPLLHCPDHENDDPLRRQDLSVRGRGVRDCVAPLR